MTISTVFLKLNIPFMQLKSRFHRCIHRHHHFRCTRRRRPTHLVVRRARRSASLGGTFVRCRWFGKEHSHEPFRKHFVGSIDEG